MERCQSRQVPNENRQRENYKNYLHGRKLSHGVFDNPKLYFLSDFIYLKRFIGPSKVISLGDILIALGLYFALMIIVRKRGA